MISGFRKTKLHKNPLRIVGETYSITLHTQPSILYTNNAFQDFSESDKARSVRLLLAKHSDQVNQLISRQPTQPTQITRSNNNLDPSSFETSDDFVSHNHILPGDRY